MAARLVGQALSDHWGSSVVIDNRAGAGGGIATELTAKSNKDGYTMMLCNIGTHGITPATSKKLPYDYLNDFSFISRIGGNPNVIMAHPLVSIRSISDLIANAKSNPGKLNYVSQGVGTSAHIFGQMFARQAGIDIVHVPYKGANDVAKDFIAGRVHLQFASSSAAVALAKTGELRLLALVAQHRSTLFPELPTMGEQGIKGIDIESWIGFVGPSGMAPATVNRLSEALAQILKSPGIQEAFRSGGVEAKWAGPEEFSSIIRNSHRQWGQTLGELGYKKE